MNCNNCQFVCNCCKSDTGIRCSGCECNKDEFILNDKWIKFCPLTGESMSKSDESKDSDDLKNVSTFDIVYTFRNRKKHGFYEFRKENFRTIEEAKNNISIALKEFVSEIIVEDLLYEYDIKECMVEILDESGTCHYRTTEYNFSKYC